MGIKLLASFLMGLFLGPLALYFIILPFPIRNAIYVEYEPGPISGAGGGMNFQYGSEFARNPDGSAFEKGTFYLMPPEALAPTGLSEVKSVCVEAASSHTSRDGPAQLDIALSFKAEAIQRFTEATDPLADGPLLLMLDGYVIGGAPQTRHPDGSPAWDATLTFSRHNIDALALFTEALSPLDPLKPCDLTPFGVEDPDTVIEPEALADFKAWTKAHKEAWNNTPWW